MTESHPENCNCTPCRSRRSRRYARTDHGDYLRGLADAVVDIFRVMRQAVAGGDR